MATGRSGTVRAAVAWVAVVVLVGLVAPGCSSDDEGAADGGSPSSVPGPSGPSVAQVSPDELEQWQADLLAVGCWTGIPDGTMAPETEAAVEAFQSAAGLPVDGLLGPQTEAALQSAVAGGTLACTAPPDTAGAGSATPDPAG